MKNRKNLFWNRAACVFMIAGGAFACLLYQTHLIGLGYNMSQMEKEKKELERVHAELQIEIASLASLERIERIAVGNLGMIPGNSNLKIMVAEKDNSGKAPAIALAERETTRPLFK